MYLKFWPNSFLLLLALLRALSDVPHSRFPFCNLELCLWIFILASFVPSSKPPGLCFTRAVLSTWKLLELSVFADVSISSCAFLRVKRWATILISLSASLSFLDGLMTVGSFGPALSQKMYVSPIEFYLIGQ